jgi:hypothetical protein
MTARVIPFPRQATPLGALREDAANYLTSTKPLVWVTPEHLRYTEAVKRLVDGPEHAGWLVQVISKAQREKAPSPQRWTFTTGSWGTGRLTCELEDSSGALQIVGPRKYRQAGFAPGCITFWCVLFEGVRVLMLPEECLHGRIRNSQ